MTTIFLLIFSIISYCLAETWNVYVYTGNELYAGTDSNVYIRLINAQDESTSEIQLTHYNWMPDNNQFPIRNLFEKGAKERFKIRTEDIKDVAKIYIRHNNFPAIQPDWLLDQVIVERIGDGTKYIFPCNCWLRRQRPFTTIFALPDQRTIDKDRHKNSTSKNNRAFIIIVVILIAILVCIFCGYNEYRRRKRHRPVHLNDAIERIQQEPALLDSYHPQASPSSGPRFWMDTLRRWKNVRHSVPSYNHASTTQSAPAAPETETIPPTDLPPAYEDLYPNSTPPINTRSDSNV